MEVYKAAAVREQGEVSEEDLALIHDQSRRKLTAEEVYTFSVRLCDNEIDREGERFPAETLAELAELFVGKCGVFDHRWSAREQVARIYRTELVREEQVRTGAGDGYCYLKGWAYMLRTEGNRDLIAEIEGGIKREISVGCSVERAVCSVCGEDIHDRERCVHVKGRRYGEKLCWAELMHATDAYEWSFVAVPAQKRAGVMKGLGAGGTLRELVRDQPIGQAELEKLEQEAGLGRRYLAGLRREVTRLGGLAEPDLPRETMKGIVDKLEEGELQALKRAYEDRLESLWPVEPQLPNGGGSVRDDPEDRMFQI